MSLFYTEGYLNSMEVTTIQQELEKNIKNLLIVPPENNQTNITVSIFNYSPYSPTYQIHLLQESVFLKGHKLQKDVKYFIQVSNGSVQLYYEEDE